MKVQSQTTEVKHIFTTGKKYFSSCDSIVQDMYDEIRIFL